MRRFRDIKMEDFPPIFKCKQNNQIFIGAINYISNIVLFQWISYNNTNCTIKPINILSEHSIYLIEKGDAEW
jgi:hypothetical protein